MSAPTASERWNDPHIMAALQLSLRCAAQHHGTAGRAGACVDCIAAALSTAEAERDDARAQRDDYGLALTASEDRVSYVTRLYAERGEQVKALVSTAEGLAKVLEDVLESFDAEFEEPTHDEWSARLAVARERLTAYRAARGGGG